MTHRLDRSRRAAAVVIAALLTVAAGDAAAHLQLLESSPGAGTELSGPPQEIVLRFSAAPEQAFAAIEWFDSGRWRRLPTQVSGAEVRAVLPPVSPGTHRIRWRVMSGDGHHQLGGFDCTVR